MLRRAFTLVELLLVVSIIAVLAAILFPVLNRVRENGRRTSCQSNLKQIGMGISQYIQDNNEKYPIAFNAKGNWGQATMPYIKSTPVFKCPSNLSPNFMVSGIASAPKIPISYAMNTRLDHLESPGVTVPAQKIEVGECAGGLPHMASDDWGGSWHNAWLLGATADHLSTANCLFVDGHVKALKLEATMAPFNMWGGFETPDGGCKQGDINCDAPDADALRGIRQMELSR